MSETRKGFLFEPKRQRLDSDNCDSDSSSHSASSNSSRMENLKWCRCGNCAIMPTMMENECCLEIDAVVAKTDIARQCITQVGSFDKMCLDTDVLEAIMAALKEVVGEDLQDPISNRLYRYVAYRSFNFWIYGKLGRKRRKVIPACAVLAIRNKFPAEDGQYKGYREAIDDHMPDDF